MSLSLCLSVLEQADLHVHIVNGYPGMMVHLVPTLAVAMVACLTGCKTRRWVSLRGSPRGAGGT